MDQDPAASGCAEPAPEAEVEVDDVEESDGTTHEHILEGEDMPGLRCVAGEVGSDDLDVERVLKEFCGQIEVVDEPPRQQWWSNLRPGHGQFFEGWQSPCQQHNCRTN